MENQTQHLMAWNIRLGGGRRVPKLLDAIESHRPNLLVLCEFRNNKVADELRGGLAELGLVYQAAPKGPAVKLSVLIASRTVFTPGLLLDELPLWPFRSIRADFPEFTLFGFYLPTGERKRPLLRFMKELFGRCQKRPTLLVGDFNTGLPYQDEHGAELTCAAEFQELLCSGWIDLWRTRHPLSRERSYYEKPWLGYRIDHALGTPLFDQQVREVSYSHSEREQGISDHSSLHVLFRTESPE